MAFAGGEGAERRRNVDARPELVQDERERADIEDIIQFLIRVDENTSRNMTDGIWGPSEVDERIAKIRQLNDLLRPYGFEFQTSMHLALRRALCRVNDLVAEFLEIELDPQRFSAQRDERFSLIQQAETISLELSDVFDATYSYFRSRTRPGQHFVTPLNLSLSSYAVLGHYLLCYLSILRQTLFQHNCDFEISQMRIYHRYAHHEAMDPQALQFVQSECPTLWNEAERVAQNSFKVNGDLTHEEIAEYLEYMIGGRSIGYFKIFTEEFTKQSEGPSPVPQTSTETSTEVSTYTES